MCIIVFKPAGNDFPTDDVFRNCFENNSDGAGFAYPSPQNVYSDGDLVLATKGKVIIRKGLMTFKEFLDAKKEAFFNEETGKWRTDLPVVFHFRIRTHGKSDAGATQPIAVTTKNGSLRATSCETSVAMAHNGIISKYCDDSSKLSDSQLFAKKFLTAMKLYQDITTHKCEVIRDVIGYGNKMVIMNGSGEIAVIGDFEIVNGCYYSNTSYMDFGYGFTYARAKHNTIFQTKTGLGAKLSDFCDYYDM